MTGLAFSATPLAIESVLSRGEGGPGAPGEKHYHSSNNQQLITLHFSHLHHPKKEWEAKIDCHPQTFKQTYQELAFKMEGAHLL